MAIVYWIRHPEHTDIFSQGYVGYSSKSLDERFAKHIIDASGPNQRNYTLHNAIRKYGKDILIKSVVLVGSEDYCLDIESKLRPVKNTGWNQAVGGFKPPSMLGREMSAETKEKIGKSNKKIVDSMTDEARVSRYAYLKGLKRSPETLEKYKKAQEGKHTSWLIKNANLYTWSIALEVYDYLENNTVGAVRLAKAFNTKECTINALYKKIKAGWNPSEDAAYLSWLSEYKEKQKENYGT